MQNRQKFETCLFLFKGQKIYRNGKSNTKSPTPLMIKNFLNNYTEKKMKLSWQLT